MKRKQSDKFDIAQHGGIVFRVIIAFTTLLLIGAALYSIIMNYQENGQEYHRKAIEISEYGMLLSLQKINEKPSWRDGFKKTEYENGFFTVELHPHYHGQTLYMTIISRGELKSVVEERQIQLMLQVTGADSSWVPQTMN